MERGGRDAAALGEGWRLQPLERKKDVGLGFFLVLGFLGVYIFLVPLIVTKQLYLYSFF